MVQSTAFLFVFLTHIWFHAAVNGGDPTHSLTYIYTAFSKPINQPGIHEFTAMGLLDGSMIDYYDSTVKKKIPKQPWMEERMDKDYWEKGTQSRQSKEQWFKVNLDILKERNGHKNDTALHILQWRHGCNAERKEDNSLKFISGRDEYSYDGDDYLAFDDANKRWIAPVPLAEPTKRKWDEVKMLNDYTQGYLERECVSWLTKFVNYGQAGQVQLMQTRPPEVHVYHKKSNNPNSLILHCLATGYFPPGIYLYIRRNGREVDKMDGMETTGERPNGDGTYQIKNHVEILKSDTSHYRCEVIHYPSNVHVFKDWDVSMLDTSSGPNIGPIVGGGLGVLVVGILVAGASVWIMKKKGRKGETSSNSSNSVMVGVTVAEEETVKLNAIKTDTSSNDSNNDSGKGGSDEKSEGSKRTLGSDSAQGSSNDDSNPESINLVGGEELGD